jgi:RNA polymerase sigma factor (sigma-70 family)
MRIDAVLGCRDDLLPAALLRLASDQRLVDQVRVGSERAFEALFDRHHRPVLAFCRHMLGSREEAEDVAQLTFLAAYRDLGRGERPAALRPWLYGIARHRCLSVLRARREHPVGEVTLPATDRLAAEVATREDLRAVLADVAHLPEDQRAALVLAELGDVSHDEIARILGCPRERVKALVFQARSSLVASRVARETPCADVREQLATLRGGALRRTTLRRHLHDCPACSAFREQVRDQRRALRILLPVAPGLGLKRMVLNAIFGSGAGGAEGAAFTAAALSSGGLAAALVILAIPAGGITAVAAALGHAREASHVTPAAQQVVTGTASPRGRGERAGSTRHQPGSPLVAGDWGEHRPRPTQATGNTNAAHQGRPAGDSGRREPAGSQQTEAFTPLMAAGQPAPRTPAEAGGPPRANGRPKPTTPASPPRATRRPKPTMPARPPQATGRPGRSQADGRPKPTAPATTAKPPQADVQAVPDASNRGATGPPPAAREATPGPAVVPGVAPAAAATPSGTGAGGHGAGAEQPAKPSAGTHPSGA